MLHTTIDTPGVVTTNQTVFGYELWGLAALGTRRILHTIEFTEQRPDLGELDNSPESVSWGVQVPSGAQIFAATCPTSALEIVGQFWVGWLEDRTLSMMAVKQEHPFQTPLVDGEIPIFPPVMDFAGRVAVYSWRPGQEGTALWRRTFTGKIHQPVTMVAEEVVRIPGRPLATRTGVVPDLEASHAVLGWVEDRPEGAVISVALIEAGQVRLFHSEPVADSSPFGRQRLGVWAESFGCVEIDAVVQSRKAPFVYRLARFSIGQNAPLPNDVWWSTKNMPTPVFALPPEAQRPALALTNLALPAGELHAVALEHPKQRSQYALHQIFLTNDGRLYLAHTIGGGLRVARSNVSLDDPLAVVTGADAAYWGVRHPDGNLTLEAF